MPADLGPSLPASVTHCCGVQPLLLHHGCPASRGREVAELVASVHVTQAPVAGFSLVPHCSHDCCPCLWRGNNPYGLAGRRAGRKRCRHPVWSFLGKRPFCLRAEAGISKRGGTWK